MPTQVWALTPRTVQDLAPRMSASMTGGTRSRLPPSSPVKGDIMKGNPVFRGFRPGVTGRLACLTIGAGRHRAIRRVLPLWLRARAFRGAIGKQRNAYDHQRKS